LIYLCLKFCNNIYFSPDNINPNNREIIENARKVVIKNLQSISKNFSYDVHVEYQSFYDHSTIKTKIYNEFKAILIAGTKPQDE